MKSKLLLFISAILIISFSIQNQTIADTRNVVVEFATGTWCQWCPCGDYTAEQILLTHPGTIFIAYHGPYNYGGDPFTAFNGYNIITLLSFTQYPTATIDRTNSPYNYAYTSWTSGVNSEYTSSPNSVINVALTALNYNSSTRVLTATVASTALQTLADQYLINYIITEDGVVYNQTNNGVCISGGSNYIHKWIVRNMVNGPSGDNLNSGTWNQNQTITTNINTTLDNAWVATNCQLTVFVYKSSSPMYMSNIMQGIRQDVTNPLGIEKNKNVPTVYSLSQNYPNPFNPTTNIKFSIPEDGNVSLKIYDITGAVIQTYVNGFMHAGTYNAEIDGSNLASGVYFYTLKTNDFQQTKKMMLVK